MKVMVTVKGKVHAVEHSKKTDKNTGKEMVYASIALLQDGNTDLVKVGASKMFSMPQAGDLVEIVGIVDQFSTNPYRISGIDYRIIPAAQVK